MAPVDPPTLGADAGAEVGEFPWGACATSGGVFNNYALVAEREIR